MKIIKVFICKLHKKFEDAGLDMDPIETVWGRGYRINTEGQPFSV
jgi:DNA-binding response OmpR family regulator